MGKKIYIIAGEASGDNIGGYLLKTINEKYPDSIIHGIGGEKMNQQGLKSLFPMQELSLFGFFEILPHIFAIKKRINQTINDIISFNPDVIITIDSPGFCLNVTKKIRKLVDRGKMHSKLVHYVAPSVWAYKEKRAKKFARIYDQILSILPFERAYFKNLDVDCIFVGHPIAEMKYSNYDFRTNYHISENSKILSIMPGSRKGEIKRMLPIFIDVIKRISSKNIDINVVFLAMPQFAKYIEEQTKDLDIAVYVISDDNQRKGAIAQSDISLAKSGTGSLEISANKIPCVISYKVNPLSYFMLKLMMKVKFANLINIVSGEEIIPEMLQSKAKPKKITIKLLELLQDKDLRERHIKIAQLSLSKMGVGKGKPSDKACAAIFKD